MHGNVFVVMEKSIVLGAARPHTDAQVTTPVRAQVCALCQCGRSAESLPVESVLARKKRRTDGEE